MAENLVSSQVRTKSSTQAPAQVLWLLGVLLRHHKHTKDL